MTLAESNLNICITINDTLRKIQNHSLDYKHRTRPDAETRSARIRTKLTEQMKTRRKLNGISIRQIHDISDSIFLNVNVAYATISPRKE